MPLHPQVREFVEAAKESGLPKIYTLSPDEARAQASSFNEFVGPGPEVAGVETLAIPVAGTTIGGRAYRPQSSHGTIVWFHGGGWVTWDLESHDAMCRSLATAAEATVISVDFRRAPEHRFPGPLDDCWASLQWIAEQHPSTPLVVGGDSSGGNLAAACALRARDHGGPQLALQVLVYPVTDHDMTTPSYVAHGGEDALLSRLDMEWFFDQYVPDHAERDNPEVSPLQANDLSNVAPAIVVTAEYDPLRDEGLAYVARLRDDGVPVTAHHYDDMVHAFFTCVGIFERGDEAIATVGNDVRAALAAQPAD